MDAKPWWTSKLMWLAIVEAIFGVVDLFADGKITSQDWDAGLVLLGAAATAIFRAFTSQAVTLTKGR